MKKNIFLIGFMGSGKSTVGRMMARRYGYELSEMDEEIEKQQGKKISEIFAEDGEEYFRNLETEYLRGFTNIYNRVVSCGGGVPLRVENVEAMKQSGVVVFLKASPETVYNRVKNSHNRPLLEDNMNVEYIMKLMNSRLSAYQAATDLTIVVDQKKLGQICEEILTKLGRMNGYRI